MKWIVSYLPGSCQTIEIQGKLSVPISFVYGVPQGSVLGYLSFIVFTTTLSQIMSNIIFMQKTDKFTHLSKQSYINKLLQRLLLGQDWMFYKQKIVQGLPSALLSWIVHYYLLVGELLFETNVVDIVTI